MVIKSKENMFLNTYRTKKIIAQQSMCDYFLLNLTSFYRDNDRYHRRLNSGNLYHNCSPFLAFLT